MYRYIDRAGRLRARAVARLPVSWRCGATRSACRRAIGLNFGFLIGVIAGVLSFIPYVGSITAFVLSIIVAIVQGWPHINLPIEAVALVTMGLIMDGYVLSPRLVGASVGLHPVWIMFALLAFGALFGFTWLIVPPCRLRRRSAR